MIRLARPSTVPPSLKRWGEKRTKLDCAAYDARPNDYQDGTERFAKKEYYKSRPVKKSLVEMHGSKCCYCESLFADPGYLHVEHFRPSGGVRQELDQKEDELPGYYWMTYKWENLFLACLGCNSSHKGTRFPLADASKRARSHHADLRDEDPLFIDPAEDDPRSHIRFDEDLPFGTTEEGKKSIDGLGLRRPELRVQRRKVLGEIETRISILDAAASSPKDSKLQALASKARAYIEEARQPGAEFSSMVIDFTTG